MPDITNMEKYRNYREQMGRLKKARDNGFLLEAVFIEYAVLEDRCEALLRHAGVFRADRHDTLQKKLGKIDELARGKKGLMGRYVTCEMVDEIRAWKDQRNVLIHALMKQKLTDEVLEALAAQGQKLAKTLCSKTTSYKRMMEKQQKKEEGKPA